MLKVLALTAVLASCGMDTAQVEQQLTTTVTKLYDFAHDDGYAVRDSWTLMPDGALYETAWKGGTGAYQCGTPTVPKTCYCGTVQRLDPATGAFSVVHVFSGLDSTGRNLDGCQPVAPVSYDSGRMYVVAPTGGTGGNPIRPALGEISSMLLDGTDVRAEWMFGQPRPGGGYIDGGGGADGGLVWNRPECPGGHVAYGAVHAGLYVFDPAAHTLVLKYGWPARAPNGTNTTGYQSYGSPIISADCKLVGVTYYGGANARGTIYQVDPHGAVDGNGYWTDAVALYSMPPYTFTGNTDNTPVGSPVMDANGSIFVAVSYGLTNGTGGILKVETTATVLHEYGVWTNAHGLTPGGAIPLGTPAIGTDGNVYVTTFYGDNGNGTLGRVTPDGLTYVDLYSLLQPNLAWPFAGMTQVGSSWYGTTGYYGVNGGGSIFQLTITE